MPTSFVVTVTWKKPDGTTQNQDFSFLTSRADADAFRAAAALCNEYDSSFVNY